MTFPFMPLYFGDYMGDTTQLTTLQHGAYFLLLGTCWQHEGELPDDDEVLAAIVKQPIHEWKKIRPKLAIFFQISRRKWRHKRVDKELQKAQHLHEVRSKAGSKGIAKRWQTDSKNIARARVPQPQPQKDSLRGRSLRPGPVDKSRSVPAAGGSGRQRAGGALPPPPAGEAAKDPAATVGDMKPVGRALPKHLRVPDPETSRENLSDGFRAADREREELRQRAYDFAAQKYPEEQRRAAFLGLGGGDPEHDAEWWLDTLNECMEVEQWQQT